MINGIIAVSSPAVKLFADNKLQIDDPAIKAPIATMGQTVTMTIETQEGINATVSARLYPYGVTYTRNYMGETVKLQIEPLDNNRGEYSLIRIAANGVKTEEQNKEIYQNGPDAILKRFIGIVVC